MCETDKNTLENGIKRSMGKKIMEWQMKEEMPLEPAV